MPWPQIYNPLPSPLLSALAALLPALLLLLCLGVLRLPAPRAALLGLLTAGLVAFAAYRQPPLLALTAAVYGVAYGLLPIGWIILNLLFFFHINREAGLFTHLQNSLASLTRDRRLQLVLIAFCFGAFLEGAAGFGTPAAVSSSLLVGLGFPALQAAALSLLANTAPVPFAGLGTPLIALETVSGLDLQALTRATVLQLSLIDLFLPFWLVAAWCGLRRMREVWPALLTAGVTYALAQFAVAWLHGPWLVNVASALVSLGAVILVLRFWSPPPAAEMQISPGARSTRGEILRAWAPWALLTGLIFLWGLAPVRGWLDSLLAWQVPIPGLHLQVLRTPPVANSAAPLPAVFDLPLLSTPGSAILLAALLSGLSLHWSPGRLLRAWLRTLRASLPALATISTMMALGFVMRYAGMDGTLGLAFAAAGPFYPFVAPLLGWLGVAITGSDTSSNVLFGSLQRISAEQLGLDALQITAANSSGGVMGKMVNAQSIVIASAAAGTLGQEGQILRRLAGHSLALLALTSLIVWLLTRFW